MNHQGKTTPLRATPANWTNPSFSPDGRRLAIDIIDKAQDVWVYDWARDTLSPLTFDSADDRTALWTPDARRITFSSNRADTSAFNLYWQRADGTGEIERLTESKNTPHDGRASGSQRRRPRGGRRGKGRAWW